MRLTDNLCLISRTHVLVLACSVLGSEEERSCLDGEYTHEEFTHEEYTHEEYT